MPGSHGRHVIVPTKLAALATGVPEATIRKWASRGKLTRYGRPGRAEYDLDELYELGLGARASSRDMPVPEPAEAVDAGGGQGSRPLAGLCRPECEDDVPVPRSGVASPIPEGTACYGDANGSERYH
jgi:hypothetical protein